MPFEFSLQRILRLTDNEKSQLEVEYGRVYNMLEDVAEKLLNLLRKKDDITNELERKITEYGASVLLLQKQQRYLESLDALIVEQQNQYELIRVQLEQSKAILLEKSIELKKYEKLRHREEETYRKEMTARESKSFDEVASHKYFYN